ncbi:MAG: hypothetical protein KBI30_01375 [Candidatus Atribacteria bacterium]|nr:hypothetical protein [Candidatus Atribacteria bacterium]
MRKVKIKSVSVYSFANFGFFAGIVLGIIGVFIKIINPTFTISVGLPFFSYSPTRTFGSLFLLFILAVLFTIFDMAIIAILVNIILKLSKGIDIRVEDA